MVDAFIVWTPSEQSIQFDNSYSILHLQHVGLLDIHEFVIVATRLETQKKPISPNSRNKSGSHTYLCKPFWHQVTNSPWSGSLARYILLSTVMLMQVWEVTPYLDGGTQSSDHDRLFHVEGFIPRTLVSDEKDLAWFFAWVYTWIQSLSELWPGLVSMSNWHLCVKTHLQKQFDVQACFKKTRGTDNRNCLW